MVAKLHGILGRQMGVQFLIIILWKKYGKVMMISWMLFLMQLNFLNVWYRIHLICPKIIANNVIDCILFDNGFNWIVYSLTSSIGDYFISLNIRARSPQRPFYVY